MLLAFQERVLYICTPIPTQTTFDWVAWYRERHHRYASELFARA